MFRTMKTKLAFALLVFLLSASCAFAQSQSATGWYWPSGSADSGGYLGWLGYNSSTYPWHLAQDMKCDPQGHAVYSIGDGNVILSRTNVGGYGPGYSAGGALVARYQAADGTWFTALYGHLDNPHGIGTVSAGQIIGYTNGFAPPHVHFAIHPGYDPEPTDPWRGYTSDKSNLYGFTDPIAFLNAHARTTTSVTRYPGTNPSPADIRAKLIAAGQKWHIPPHILFGIAWQESGWRQYGSDGYTLVSPDGGIGIMQLTGSTAAQFDVNRLAYDIDYNIDAGANVLVNKWNATPIIGDGVGQNGREKLENWYYSIWAYNSFSSVNNPLYNSNSYQHRVIGIIASCPNGQWDNCQITEPSASEVGDPPQQIANTPSPIHSDADFNGVIDGGSSSGDISVSESSAAASDGAPGFWRSGTPGYWHDATDAGDGGHMLWTYNNRSTTDNQGDWRPALPQDGNYEVYVFIPHNHATTRSAHYDIYAANTVGHATLNQYQYSDVWVSLGTYQFSTGTSGHLHLIDMTGEADTTTEIGFDTAKWVYRGNPNVAPSVSFNEANKDRWFNDPNLQVVPFSLQDQGGGIGGLSQAWDGDPGGSSPQFPGSTGGYLVFGYLPDASRQGIHTAYVRAWNSSLNQSQVFSSGWYGFDSLPPTVTITSSQTPGSTYTTSQNVTWHIADAGCGLSAWGQAWDSDPGQQYSTSDGGLTLPVGTHTLHVHTWDNLGNNKDWTFGPYTYTPDAGPPVTTASLAGTVGSAGWYHGQVSVTLSATDPDGASDVAATYYAVDGGSQQTYSAPFTVSGDGQHSLTFYSIDHQGNAESVNTVAVKIDSTAPTTTASVGTGSIVLSATDTVSGVAGTYYLLDNLPQQTYLSPLHLYGQHDIAFYSVDVAGNTETTHTAHVTVPEPVPAITSLSPSSATVGGLAFTLTINGSGLTRQSVVKWNGSGLTTTFVSANQLTVRIPASLITHVGTAGVKVVNPTPGGGVSNTQTFTVADSGPPVTTAALSGTPGNNGFYRSSVIVTLSATDPDGAGDVAATDYKVDSGSYQLYSSPFTLSGDGSHVITFYSVDKSGSSETPNTASVTIDATPPVTTATVSGATVTLSATDSTSGSGVIATLASVDGGAFQTYANAITVTGYGTHTIAYYSVDNAGNTETQKSVTVNINSPAPTLTSLTPNTALAGGPSQTVVVLGSGFLNGASSVMWNGATLATTFVSSTKLKATAPASLIASPGTASVTVVNPAPGGGASNAKSFSITYTNIKVIVSTVSRSGTNVITAHVSVQNTGYLAAQNAQIITAQLGATPTATLLPLSLGTLGAGASADVTLTFPGSAGSAGSIKTLTINGTYAGGKFHASHSLTLP